MGPEPPLPKPPGDEENLRRLRREAAERLDREQHSSPPPAPVYGGPAPVYGGPAPVYGGPPVTRRWTIRGVLGALAALAGFWAYRKMTTPAYGGPPPPQPKPPAGPGQ
ncbi:MAG TPA: hypothetical protein VMH81_23605 [Bryobacteraceae bacterium]|nr:hypothetical protein [Bryobacteraceae bacterium]